MGWVLLGDPRDDMLPLLPQENFSLKVMSILTPEIRRPPERTCPELIKEIMDSRFP